MEKEIVMYDGRVWGVKVSDYGIKKGRLDYATLATMLDGCINNNVIREATMDDWTIVAGEFEEVVFQDFIISKYGYETLRDFTNELVFYNEELDIYIWAVTHYGTSWDHVVTNVKLVDGDTL